MVMNEVKGLHELTINDIRIEEGRDYTINNKFEIRVPIVPNAELNSIMDNERKSRGYVPFYDKTEEYDNEGWYDFTAVLVPYYRELALLKIEAYVFSGGDYEKTPPEDDGMFYNIRLADYTRNFMLIRIMKEIQKNESYNL